MHDFIKFTEVLSGTIVYERKDKILAIQEYKPNNRVNTEYSKK